MISDRQLKLTSSGTVYDSRNVNRVADGRGCILNEDKFENYKCSKIKVELITAAWFEYQEDFRFGPCNKLPQCRDRCNEQLLLNNPYSYGCKSMNFNARIMEGEFLGHEVQVIRYFSASVVDPTRGAFMFPGRTCFVTGVVKGHRVVPGRSLYYILRADCVWRTVHFHPDTPILVNEKVHRFRGSLVHLSEEEKSRQSNAVFIC